MEFNNRKAKCKKIQKTESDGTPLPEAFYALIDDEGITQNGTPLNAETMNKGNWRDDNTVSFLSNYEAYVEPHYETTKIYTANNGETWLVPPDGHLERYQLSAGHKALNTLRDPITGQKGYLQDIANNSVNFFTKPCMAFEYDNLELTAAEYDGKTIKAFDYDVCGALTINGNGGNFSGYSIFDIRDPATGQMRFLQDILNNLFNLMTQPLTVAEYDSLNLSAVAYDARNITAINFDMRGKTILI